MEDCGIWLLPAAPPLRGTPRRPPTTTSAPPSTTSVISAQASSLQGTGRAGTPRSTTWSSGAGTPGGAHAGYRLRQRVPDPSREWPCGGFGSESIDGRPSAVEAARRHGDGRGRARSPVRRHRDRWRHRHAHATSASEPSSSGSDEDLKGHFTNAANASHVDDHFLTDFFLVILLAGQLLSGRVMTPGHMRRLREAIDTQLKLYEKETGSKVNSTIVMSPDIVLILPRRQSGNRTGESPARSESTRSGELRYRGSWACGWAQALPVRWPLCGNPLPGISRVRDIHHKHGAFGVGVQPAPNDTAPHPLIGISRSPRHRPPAFWAAAGWHVLVDVGVRVVSDVLRARQGIAVLIFLDKHRQPTEPELLVPCTSKASLPIDIHVSADHPNELTSGTAFAHLAALASPSVALPARALPQPFPIMVCTLSSVWYFMARRSASTSNSVACMASE